MDHTKVHAVVELVDKGHKAVGIAKKVNLVARGIAGSVAFRKYDWLRNAPITNVSDNLRGMVVNGNAKVT